MKVTVLTTSFPPYADSQTIRTLHLLQAMKETPWQWMFIVPGTRGEAGAEDLRELMPTSARVVRTLVTASERSRAWLALLPMGRRATALCANLWARVGFPDAQMGWDRLAVDTFESELASWKPDVLVSASGSSTAHMAAAVLSKRHGIPWVADYGDPWYLVDRSARPWLAPISNRVERAVLSAACHMVVTTEETRDAYRKWLGAAQPPTTVLPYGYVDDAAYYVKSRPGLDSPKPDDQPLVLAHVGAAYVANRNLLPLIRAVARLRGVHPARRVALRVIGNQSMAFQNEARALGLKNTEFVGRVGYLDANRYISCADVQVVVGNDSNLQVPGKIFPLLATLRPILYIGQMDRDSDPAWRILRAFGGVIFSENNEESLAIAIAGITNDYQRILSAAGTRDSDGELSKYSATAVSARFSQLLLAVAQRDSANKEGAMRPGG